MDRTTIRHQQHGDETMKKNQTLLLIGLVAILLMLPHSHMGYTNDTGSIYTFEASGSVHAPISIGSDAEFSSVAASEGWDGNGSADNPYIIEDLEIEISAMDTGISISPSVTVHYLIENCTIYGSDLEGLGIYLGGGNGTLSDSEIFNVSDGVKVEGANKTIQANHIHDFTEQGISLSMTVSAGVLDNTVVGDTLNLSDSVGTSCISVSGPTHPYNDRIQSNTVSGCDYGIFCLGDRTQIHNNHVTENGFGIWINHYNNTVTNNTIHENTWLGIELDHNADDIQVYYNIFYNNSDHAKDDGSDNIWDDGESLGNYWDDAVTASPYNIPGDANAVDRYPQLYELQPPEIEDIDELTLVQGAQDCTITWDVSDATPSHYWVFVDGSVHEEGSWDGTDITTNMSSLAIGTYNVTLKLLDRNDNTASDQLTLHVVEPTTTTIDTEPLDPTMLLALGGVGAVVLVLVVVFVKRR